MAAVTLAKTLDMDRNEWLELRRTGIGGSEASAILGLNPWKTAMDVWLDKTGEFTEDEEPDNEKKYWGTVLEDVVTREFMKRTGLKVRRKNAMLRHKDYPWMLANVDRLVVGEKAGLETKTTSVYSSEDWEDGIPDYYIPQVQHYMAVTGFPVWYVAVLIGGQEFRNYRVVRDDSFIHDLVAAETEFWGMVKSCTPPPIDGTKASSELVKRMYPLAEQNREVDLPFEAFNLIQQYEKAAEEEKKIQLVKDEATNRLKDMLGTAERGSIHGREVLWKNVCQKRLDGKALQQTCPDIYNAYLNESTYRRFSIK